MPTATEHDLVLPDLGLDGVPVSVSVWLKKTGQEVVEGERLLELLAGEVTVDLPAPATGRLAQQLAEEDEIVQAGQVLARVVADG